MSLPLSAKTVTANWQVVPSRALEFWTSLGGLEMVTGLNQAAAAVGLRELVRQAAKAAPQAECAPKVPSSTTALMCLGHLGLPLGRDGWLTTQAVLTPTLPRDESAQPAQGSGPQPQLLLCHVLL